MEYAKKVKKRLIDLDKTQKWLFEQVKELTGLYCDNSYFIKICRGEFSGANIIPAINKILGFDEGDGPWETRTAEEK